LPQEELIASPKIASFTASSVPTEAAVPAQARVGGHGDGANRRFGRLFRQDAEKPP
jgi:hypothetical protein